MTEQGYQSGKMAGYTLHFQVTITKVVRDGKTLDLEGSSPQNPLESIDGYPIDAVAISVVVAILMLCKKRQRAMIS